MRYLSKTKTSHIIREGWLYAKQGERSNIREELRREQSNYCAYSERYFAPLDACEIEHFDHRLKNTNQDDYWNWYAVHRRMNQHKRQITMYLPILQPYDPSVSERIKYEDEIYKTVAENDVEAQNLIDFLGFNHPDTVQHRLEHVNRHRYLLEQLGENAYVLFLKKHPREKSFVTALEAELELVL